MPRFRESIVIAADANTVWPFLADPVLMQRWNPEIVRVDRRRLGPVDPEEEFEIEYTRQKRTQTTVKICDPPYLVVFEHRMIWEGKEQCALQTFQLSKCSGGVRVDQRTDLTQMGIPWPWRLLVWLIGLFGRPVGNSLEKLKQLAEQSNVASLKKQ